MTAHLTRLRIAGFKSFAEPAVLDILPGLTGIVGPNGCGKSNVVEALRWAMGETSVRSLRGGEMDDVIFAGTAARASRNLAEVTITLQKPAGSALPDPFTAEDELHVTRRIERGAGSAYRANGREFRARDIQTLFADMASGAHSSAMVSQGKVSALVNAKPEARRQVLEEAAGITGLHARRHEAELKLRAAEANLGRAEELRTQLDQGRESLRRQARQAARFRNISGLLHAAETDFLALQHARAASALASARQNQAAAQAAVDQAERAACAAAAAVADAEAALPAPAAAEAAARSQLERRRLEAESLAAEATRAKRALEEAQSRLADCESDLAAASAATDDANASLARLDTEATALAATLTTLPDALAAAECAAADAAREVGAAEQAADAAQARATEAAAAARQAALAIDAAEQRLAAATTARDEAAAARARAAAALVDPAAVAQAAAQLADSEARNAAARVALEAAEAERAASADAERSHAAAATAAAHVATEAERRHQETAARAARLRDAVDSLHKELAQAESRRIAAESLASARDAAAKAAIRADEAERTALAAEGAQARAAAHRLQVAACAERLAGEHARLREILAEATARQLRLADERVLLTAQRDAIHAQQVDPQLLAEAASRADAAEDRATCAAAALHRLGEARACAEASLADARARAAAAAGAVTRLLAEAEGLRHALAGHADEAAGLLDTLELPPGLELALGAAFADADGGLDQASPSFWRALPDLPPPALPQGTLPMAGMVAAPPALRRALAHIFLAPEGTDGNGFDGHSLQGLLPGGATLVSRAGDAWRWDGHVRRAGAPNAAAARLALRARLREVETSLAEACEHDASARGAEADAHAAAGAASAFETDARVIASAATADLAHARAAHAALAAQAEKAAAGLAALAPATERLSLEQQAADSAHETAAAALAALPDAGQAAAVAAEAATASADADAALAAARTDRDAARRAAAEHAVALATLEQQAAEAESKVAALQPQLSRLAQDCTEAAMDHGAAAAAMAVLPNLTALDAAAADAHAAARSAAQAVADARQERAASDEAVRAAAVALARLRSDSAQADHALAARDTLLARAEADVAHETASCDAARAAGQSLPDAAALADQATAARHRLAACRAVFAAATAAQADLANADVAARARAPQLAEERLAWRQRADEASRRARTLTVRRDAVAADVQALADAPAVLADRAASSGAALQAAQAAHDEAAASLRDAHATQRAAVASQRSADTHAAACREILARGEGACETAAAALAAVRDRVAERLGPDTVLPEPDDLSEAAEERARKKLDRLQREREEMGPVNLRADIELAELDEKIAAIDTDREELGTAIAKLRGSIGHLNREGRERLAAVFTEVDRHFRALFTRMMGGGRAHLALTGSEDPLEAGLEIYAEPPGKKLSTLSLLSGGEQALTALSLIFAVFRCTPAPVAVLDEVDAPLDDANVDRFCGLLEDVVRDTGTRFLVVTHHQLTMSRMDRLFGVTMQERGVSRLLSVDLQRAAAMVEPARVAAE
jgi:chromosome segregation protein